MMDLDSLDHGAAIGGCALSLELICDCRTDKPPCRIEQFAYEPVIDGAVLRGKYMVVTGESGTQRRGERAGVAVLRCPHCGRHPRIRHVRMVKEYVRGPVNVVGKDIYGLDRDGDGVGCES